REFKPTDGSHGSREDIESRLRNSRPPPVAQAFRPANDRRAALPPSRLRRFGEPRRSSHHSPASRGGKGCATVNSATTHSKTEELETRQWRDAKGSRATRPAEPAAAPASRASHARLCVLCDRCGDCRVGEVTCAAPSPCSFAARGR